MQASSAQQQRQAPAYKEEGLRQYEGRRKPKRRREERTHQASAATRRGSCSSTRLLLRLLDVNLYHHQTGQFCRSTKKEQGGWTHLLRLHRLLAVRLLVLLTVGLLRRLGVVLLERDQKGCMRKRKTEKS